MSDRLVKSEGRVGVRAGAGSELGSTAAVLKGGGRSKQTHTRMPYTSRCTRTGACTDARTYECQGSSNFEHTNHLLKSLCVEAEDVKGLCVCARVLKGVHRWVLICVHVVVYVDSAVIHTRVHALITLCFMHTRVQALI